MRTLVFRDFAVYDENGNVDGDVGSILIYHTENNSMEIIINGLHDIGQGIQAFMTIKYTSKLELYDIIDKILNTISYDLYYKYNGNETHFHKDFILHDHIKKKNKKIWNRDRNKNSIGAEWIPYTRENMKHITTEKQNDFYYNNTDFIVIRGEVDINGDFTYDYPIVDKNCSIETYRESRGNMDYFYDP